MSNVLIGVIGVILFIGLALAGALFLGPQFQSATTDSTVSSISQALSQTSHALELYNAQEEIPITVGGLNTTVTAGYLKSRPYTSLIRGEAGSVGVGIPIKYVVVIANSTLNPTIASDKTCQSLAKKVGMSGAEQLVEAADAPAGLMGCCKSTTAWGSQPAGSYIYFQRY